jgi:hypothetical protein
MRHVHQLGGVERRKYIALYFCVSMFLELVDETETAAVYFMASGRPYQVQHRCEYDWGLETSFLQYESK